LAQKNITVDGRFSNGPVPYNSGVYSIGANLGKQAGGNLFHSFGKFGLATGETAAFTSTGSTAPINNVIGRVTGGSRSDINGNIKSDIARANLFLINPSGIVFGPNATVNVSGAFHASTADYLKMADGAKFQATHPDGSTLSAAPPAAFGFLTATQPRSRSMAARSRRGLHPLGRRRRTSDWSVARYRSRAARSGLQPVPSMSRAPPALARCRSTRATLWP
jgi:filamentous hemagglutinin family protein